MVVCAPRLRLRSRSSSAAASRLLADVSAAFHADPESATTASVERSEAVPAQAG